MTEEGLRLVDLANFENAYILCVRDNEAVIRKLNDALNAFNIGINERPPMNKEEAERYFRSLIV
ncbi:hypothetical protein [Moellerella wisconsensis]|uniref:Uncharacterized protein n=1 Tax=Moellerella wisconsensis TaxID=158849 RepID=A0A9Q8Q2Q9_9GAMM|nr:hypothetical protein [Moellerella wisconsensis]UNH31395.1 hypothetical protein MNY72_03485 [Moellerella wisconsensis]